MLKKVALIVLLLFTSFYAKAQGDINNYKYIIVPDKFEVQNEANAYKLNGLTEFLFNKYGYQAYLANEALPEDLKAQRCLGLTADVVTKKGGLFKTKLEIILKDCYGTEVMRSKIGESREKQFSQAYNEALRDAFTTYQEFEYSYVPKTSVEQIETEKSSFKGKEEVAKAITNRPTNKVEEYKIIKKDKAPTEETKAVQIYYAQAIGGGYQLVDAEPKIVMILLDTNVENVFLVKDKNAIVHKKNGQWLYFENNGKNTIDKTLTIKF